MLPVPKVTKTLVRDVVGIEAAPNVMILLVKVKFVTALPCKVTVTWSANCAALMFVIV